MLAREPRFRMGADVVYSGAMAGLRSVCTWCREPEYTKNGRKLSF